MNNKILFICDSEVKFYDPRTHKKLWYGSDYPKGTNIEIKRFLCGNWKEIRFECLDGEMGSVETQAVMII